MYADACSSIGIFVPSLSTLFQRCSWCYCLLSFGAYVGVGVIGVETRDSEVLVRLSLKILLPK